MEKFAKTIEPNKLWLCSGRGSKVHRLVESLTQDAPRRPYWLRTAGKAYKTNSKVRAFSHPKAPTIRKGTWVVKAQWYLSSAVDHRILTKIPATNFCCRIITSLK